MKTMSWEQIDKDWSGLQKKHRMEIAQSVARYCIGHKTSEVASRLGFGETWIRSQLDYAGIGAAIGEGSQLTTPGLRTSTADRSGVDRAVRKVVKDFAPDVKVKLSGQGGDQSVTSVEGKDAEEFEPYLQHYLDDGHEPAAATRLAKAKWAAEAAVDAGVIKEDVNKRNEKVNRILFPRDSEQQFVLDLQGHMATCEASCTLPEFSQDQPAEEESDHLQGL